MNVVYAVLVCLALTVIEFLTGGTRLVFSLPAYGLLALAGVLSLVDIRRPKLPANGLCLASSAIFFGYVLVRSLTSPVAYLAWYDRFMVLAALVVYLLTACLLTDPRRRLWVLFALLALALANLFVGAKQFASGQGYMLFGFIRSPQYAGRASGLYICPDHLAAFLEVVGCLGLAVALWSRNRGWVKLLVGYASLCCMAGMLLTASRGGFLSLAAGLGVLTILGLLRLRQTAPGMLPRAILAILTVVGLAGGGLVVATHHNTMLETRAKALFDRTDARLMLWPSAVENFEVSPVFGTGSATFLFYGRKFRDVRIQMDPVRPHNDYLELLAEYGAVGAAGFLFFLGVHLRWGWRAFSHLSLRFGGESGGSNGAAWNIGCLSAVTCLVVHSVVDFNLHIPANTLLMAFIFGQLANPGRSLAAGDQSARLRPVDLLPRLALVALSVWLLVDALPKLPSEYFAEQARVALRDGHELNAINLARQATEREPHNPLPFYYMGEARLLIAEHREAAGQAGAADLINESFRRDALESLRRAADLAPMDSIVLMRLGETLTRLGMFDEARPVFERLMSWDPNSGTAQTYYGFYLQRAGRPMEAEAAYRRALGLDPKPAATTGLEQILRAREAR